MLFSGAGVAMTCTFWVTTAAASGAVAIICPLRFRRLNRISQGLAALGRYCQATANSRNKARPASGRGAMTAQSDSPGRPAVRLIGLAGGAATSVPFSWNRPTMMWAVVGVGRVCQAAIENEGVAITVLSMQWN